MYYCRITYEGIGLLNHFNPQCDTNISRVASHFHAKQESHPKWRPNTEEKSTGTYTNTKRDEDAVAGSVRDCEVEFSYGNSWFTIQMEKQCPQNGIPGGEAECVSGKSILSTNAITSKHQRPSAHQSLDHQHTSPATFC